MSFRISKKVLICLFIKMHFDFEQNLTVGFSPVSGHQSTVNYIPRELVLEEILNHHSHSNIHYLLELRRIHNLSKSSHSLLWSDLLDPLLKVHLERDDLKENHKYIAR